MPRHTRHAVALIVICSASEAYRPARLPLESSSFWVGAVHAATPGHGKTIAAAYIVGIYGGYPELAVSFCVYMLQSTEAIPGEL